MVVKIHELTKTNLLGSRQTAETIREIILQHIQKGEKITLDFENISLITHKNSQRNRKHKKDTKHSSPLQQKFTP